MITRLCVTAFAVTAQVACASAPRTRSFAELPKFLKTGNTIQLTDSAGTTSIGRVGTMSPTTLRLWVGGDPHDVLAGDVTNIARQESRTRRGALIGLALGFGVGLIAARGREPSGNPYLDSTAAGGDLLVGIGLGTAVGAIVGGRVKVQRTVYEAPVTP